MSCRKRGNNAGENTIAGGMNTSTAGTTSALGTITIANDLCRDGPVSAGHGADSINLRSTHASYTIRPIDSIGRSFDNEGGS